MNAQLEKEISTLALKSAGLQHRANTVLAVGDMLNEAIQLNSAQAKQSAALVEVIKGYENKSADPVGESVQRPAPTAA